MKFRFWFQAYDAGSSQAGSFAHRPGTLPQGGDVLPPAVVTMKEGLSTCSKTTGCTGITFEADSSTDDGKARKTWFKQKTVEANGQAGWQSYVVDANPSHYNLPRYYYQTEASAGEYDIPPAFRRAGEPQIPGYPWLPVSSKGNLHLTPGTSCTGDCPDGPDCVCVHTITYHWPMSNARMLYAGGHCHAPSCISIELDKNDTGMPELLCNQTTVYGKGEVSRDKYDELGYIVLPPCLWGDDAGLDKPAWLPPNTPMFSIKRNYNTHAGHYGEMASWQMRGVGFSADQLRVTV